MTISDLDKLATLIVRERGGLLGRWREQVRAPFRFTLPRQSAAAAGTA